MENFSVPSECGAVQISPKQILVFGGQSDSQMVYNFVLNILKGSTTNYVIDDINSYDMDFEGSIAANP